MPIYDRKNLWRAFSYLFAKQSEIETKIFRRPRVLDQKVFLSDRCFRRFRQPHCFGETLELQDGSFFFYGVRSEWLSAV